MTVINNIEIDNINYKRNIIKDAIINNDPIEDKLNVIMVVSNPCQFARRYILAKQFIKRMEMEENNIRLFIVELIYPNQKYYLTKSNNKNHLQLKTTIPIWHKENMINLGVKYLLPKDWKAVAWIDADIEFENTTWALDTLKVLNGTKDIVQLFSHCVDMNYNYDALNIFSSFGYKFTKNENYSSSGVNYWHPGFAWACTRKAFEKMGGLYENAILGSGDHIMAYSLINKGLKSIHYESTDDYKQTIIDFGNRVKNLRLGYVPGVIRHHFHGLKINRKYKERWLILMNNNYAPTLHLTKDEIGVLIPSVDCPDNMLDEIYEYFHQRNEDDYYV